MIDVRNPGDGFRSLRARVNALGPPAAGGHGVRRQVTAARRWSSGRRAHLAAAESALIGAARDRLAPG